MTLGPLQTHGIPKVLLRSIDDGCPRARFLTYVAAQGEPLFAIHGDADEVVPLEHNSEPLRARVAELGGSMELAVAAGQGHNMWVGFFQCERLVAFVIEHAEAT